MHQFTVEFMSRGGGMTLIGLFVWLAPCLLTDYRKTEIPQQYR